METKKSGPETLSVIGHLEELRRRLWLSIAFMAAGSVLCLVFSKDIVLFLELPARKIITGFILLKPAEIVSVYVKVALCAGCILTSPAVLHQLWLFIRPALPDEARLSFFSWAFPAAFMFLIGSAFAFWVLVPAALRFLVSLSAGMAVPAFTLGGYISFVLALLLLSGAMFEMPVAAAALTLARVITPSLLRAWRKEAYFSLCIIAAVLTPTSDVFNMLLFALPMIALYEASIAVSVLVQRSMILHPSEEAYVS